MYDVSQIVGVLSDPAMNKISKFSQQLGTNHDFHEAVIQKLSNFITRAGGVGRGIPSVSRVKNRESHQTIVNFVNRLKEKFTNFIMEKICNSAEP